MYLQQTNQNDIINLRGGIQAMNDLFFNIPESDKKTLLLNLRAIKSQFPSGVTVFNAENNNTIGIIDSGFVQIIRNDYNGDRILVEELSKNQIFVTRISSITSHDYEVVSVSPCTITFIDFTEIYSDRIKKLPYYLQLQENLIRIMSDIILKRNERIQVLSQKTIRERLLEYFKLISKQQKSKNITLPFTYTELADYLGINRCAMYRELGNLKDEKQISINKKVISLYFYF